MVVRGIVAPAYRCTSPHLATTDAIRAWRLRPVFQGEPKMQEDILEEKNTGPESMIWHDRRMCTRCSDVVFQWREMSRWTELRV